MGIDHIGKTEKTCTKCLTLKQIDEFYLVQHHGNKRYYRQAKENALDVEEDHLPERLKLIVDQCTVTLLGVVRRAHKLFSEG